MWLSVALLFENSTVTSELLVIDFRPLESNDRGDRN